MQNALECRHPVFMKPIFRLPRQMASARSNRRVLTDVTRSYKHQFSESKFFSRTQTPMIFTIVFVMTVLFFMLLCGIKFHETLRNKNEKIFYDFPFNANKKFKFNSDNLRLLTIILMLLENLLYIFYIHILYIIYVNKK